MLLLAAAIFGMVIMQRRIRGDEALLFGALKHKRQNSEHDSEIEAFIAAYRSGQADTNDLV